MCPDDDSECNEGGSQAFTCCQWPPLSLLYSDIDCLLYEVGKGKNSRWHPYLTQLPRSYDILASFRPFEIQSLQVNYGIWAAEMRWKRLKVIGKKPLLLWKNYIYKVISVLLGRRFGLFTISSRTLHVAWDDAGCLCPVGDLFNYAPPGEESCFENSSKWRTISSLEVDKPMNSDITKECNVAHRNDNLLRLTDGGYEKDVSAYCFYARRNYNKWEQLWSSILQRLPNIL